MNQAITSFTDLLIPLPGLEPGATQDRDRQLLPDLVRQSPMTWMEHGVSSNGSGRKLLIGVAVWNRYDLQLLDRVAHALTAGIDADTAVIVFDVDAITSPAEFDRLIPGLLPLQQTPAVGFWDGGIIRESAQGYFGRRLVAQALGLDEASVHPPALAAS